MLAGNVIPPHPNSVTERVLYVRADGSDGADGFSEATALATLEEASRRLPAFAHGERWVIDTTDTDLVVPRNFALKSPLAGDVLALDPLFADPMDLYRPTFKLRATPREIAVLDPSTTSLAAPTHGMRTFTDPTANWVPGEHVGRKLVGAGVLEWGAIQANTATQLTVAFTGPMSEPRRIVECSSEWTVGDPGDLFFNPGLALIAQCQVVASGISFRAPSGGNSLLVRSPGGGMNFLLCDIEGVTFGFGEMSYLEGCAVIGKSWAQNGQPLTVRNSLLKNLSLNSHGSGGAGLTFWLSNHVDGCGAIGHGGNAQFEGGFQYEGLRIVGGTSDGVLHRGGAPALIKDTVIEGCGGSAVRAIGPGLVTVQNVDGTGNSRYGVEAQNGAQVSRDAATSVAGSLGAFRCGANAAEASWAGFAAQNDYAAGAAAQGCRIY